MKSKIQYIKFLGSIAIALTIAFIVMKLFFGGDGTIAAIGVCNTSVPKDRLSVTLQITTVDKKAAVSLRTVQNVAADIARKLRAIKDESIEVQTENIQSYEKTKWEKNTQISLGVESQINLRITTKQKETIDAALEIAQSATLAKAFPQNMHNFSSREVIDKATAECLEKAVIDARAKAESIAKGDGKTIGRLVSAGFGTAPRGLINGSFGRSTGGALFSLESARPIPAATNYIQTSDSEITISVDAVFQIN